jgi:hypothetical protein
MINNNNNNTKMLVNPTDTQVTEADMNILQIFSYDAENPDCVISRSSSQYQMRQIGVQITSREVATGIGEKIINPFITREPDINLYLKHRQFSTIAKRYNEDSIDVLSHKPLPE